MRHKLSVRTTVPCFWGMASLATLPCSKCQIVSKLCKVDQATPPHCSSRCLFQCASCPLLLVARYLAQAFQNPGPLMYGGAANSMCSLSLSLQRHQQICSWHLVVSAKHWHPSNTLFPDVRVSTSALNAACCFLGEHRGLQ